MQKILWKRFFIAFLVLWLMFFVNLYGIYNDSYTVRYYWFSELEHFLGGFFIAFWLTSISRSRRFIWLGLIIAIFGWELTECLLANVPSLYRIVRQDLKMSRVPLEFWDTVLDIILDVFGCWIFLKFFSEKTAAMRQEL